jgi:hypothetical protein
MRVGVVADTHVGEFLPTLPSEVCEVLAGCALILHAGDLSVPSVIDELSRVAPVVAVTGDHDRLEGLRLPTEAVIGAGGRRIALTHGKSRWRDVTVIGSHVLAGRRLAHRAGRHRWLARRFGPVDCVVYGHMHEPVAEWVGETLVYSPGAVCPWGNLQGGREPRRGPKGVGDRGVRRYRAQLGREAMTPQVGVLEVGPDGIAPRWIPLRRAVL